MPTLKELWRSFLHKFAPTINDKPHTNVANASAARQRAEYRRDVAQSRNQEISDLVNTHKKFEDDVFAEKFRLALRGEGKQRGQHRAT